MSDTINGSWYVVYVWMATELGLSCTALLVYAVVYGFTTLAADHCYRGSLKTLALYTGGCRQTVHGALKHLVVAGLLRKIETGKGKHKRVTYTALRGPGGQPIEHQNSGPNTYMYGPDSGPYTDPSDPSLGSDGGSGTAGACAHVMESGEVEHVV